MLIIINNTKITLLDTLVDLIYGCLQFKDRFVLHLKIAQAHLCANKNTLLRIKQQMQYIEIQLAEINWFADAT